MVTDLFWPGEERAGALFGEEALLDAMVRVETAWLDVLVQEEVVPAGAADSLHGLVSYDDLGELARTAEGGGNPVIELVRLLRTRVEARNAEAATWLHRGLTSQDVLDTALVLCIRNTTDRIRNDLDAQIASLVGLSQRHRDSVMPGRTLTQYAVPITFGLKAASWLQGVLDAVAFDVTYPVQIGGAAGTLAAATELTALAGRREPRRAARDLVSGTAERLGLDAAPPWHTTRTPFTRFGDACARCCDAWGRIANDVLTLSRPEIAELAEPVAQGRGGSSTMPHKANPVLSVLIRRAALAAPGTAAELHLAAAEARDERPDGSWHLEWAALRTLARRTVVAGSQTTELLAGLRVDAQRMQENARSAGAGLTAERRAIAELFGQEPGDGAYLGATDDIIDAVLARARTKEAR